jgi:hypothetical protein
MLSNTKDTVRELLYTPGHVISPQNDGRLEIPQSVMRQLNDPVWDTCSEVSIIKTSGSLIIVPGQTDGETIATLIYSGRIRIPASVLKQADFEGKELSAATDSSKYIILRVCWAEHSDALDYVLDKIPNDVLNDLVSVLKGLIDFNTSEEAKPLSATKFSKLLGLDIKREEVKYSKINGIDLPETKRTRLLIPEDSPTLVLPTYKTATTFRPAEKSMHRFQGYWLKQNELVLENKKVKLDRKPDDFYLIPGFHRTQGNYRAGWLLVSKVVYGSIVSKFRGVKWLSDLILLYDPCIREENRVFVNPPDEKTFSEEDLEIFKKPDNTTKLTYN